MAETYDRNARGEIIAITGSGADAEGAGATLKARSAAGLGSHEKKGKGPMPKQRPGESLASLGERMRKWRSGEPDDDAKAEVVSRGMRD